MSYKISKDENNLLTGIYDTKVYIPKDVDVYDITNDEFEQINDSEAFSLWQYIDGKITPAPNYNEQITEMFNNKQAILRQESYIKYSDPIFMQWQRGTASKEEWLAKIDEIKLLYPYQ